MVLPKKFLHYTWKPVIVPLLLLHGLLATSPSVGAADPLRLKFDASAKQMERGDQPVVERWKYYITKPGAPFDYFTKREEIRKYLVIDKAANACRLSSRKNFAGVCRLIDPEFAQASRATWKWSVDEHPSKCKLGPKSFDAAITVYFIYQTPEVDYTALAFCWSDKTEKKAQLVPNQQMGWRESPMADVYYVSLRDGSLNGLQTETVDLMAEYRKAFNKNVPPLWAIIALADSNNSPEKFNGKSSSEAMISDIQLHK